MFQQEKGTGNTLSLKKINKFIFKTGSNRKEEKGTLDCFNYSILLTRECLKRSGIEEILWEKNNAEGK